MYIKLYRNGFCDLNFFCRYLQTNFRIGHYRIYKDMARVCQITGKKVQVGNNVSHAKNRTRRKFYPNLHTKRFYIPEEDKWITIKVSASALRTINKNGITAVIKKAREKGTSLV